MIILPLKKTMLPELHEITQQWFGKQRYQDFMARWNRIVEDGVCAINPPVIIACASIGNISPPHSAEIHVIRRRDVGYKIRQVREISHRMLKMLFERHNVAKFIGTTPTYMPWAIRFARLCGAEKFGTYWGLDVMSGRQVDHVLTTIRREEICQPPQ